MPSASMARRRETEWQRFVANQRKLGVVNPKLVCFDLHPYARTQDPERTDILNVGGFSDAVFNVVASSPRLSCKP